MVKIELVIHPKWLKMTANKPYVKEVSVNARGYWTDCLARRTLLFIKSRHHISVIIFWPDMADIYFQKEERVMVSNMWNKPITLPTVLRSLPIEIFSSFVKKITHYCREFVIQPKIWIKSRLRLVKQQSNTWKCSFGECWPEIAPGQKGRGVCNF